MSAMFFDAHRHLDDWHTTADLALGLAQKVGDQRGQAAMLFRRGVLHFVQTHYDLARTDLSHAAELYAAHTPIVTSRTAWTAIFRGSQRPESRTSYLQRGSAAIWSPAEALQMSFPCGSGGVKL